MSVNDQLHRYLFDNVAVRGELVNASETWRDIVKNHGYAEPVNTLLGELLVATSLLTATLKFEGDITVQLQGDGPLTLAVINGNHRQEMRGVARIKEGAEIAAGSSLKEMVGNGYLVITISPEKGERYQGVVGLEADTLAGCLEDYFMRSEQLPTRLFIRTSSQGVAGILLQVLPAQDTNLDDFNHLATLTETVKSDELIELPATEVLWRLYHQEEATVYDPSPVIFKCTCSHARCGEVLKTLPAEEVDEILAEDGKIDMHCDYCGSHYVYDADDIAALRNSPSNDNTVLH
ncbi:Hsp33 family molecular chaperone HslO [Pantoea sp. Mb-10]|uniref:Hsp33 family molecular chaperone HslO n=1 Tax=unclassified Pantoea TaxID=2630326 RepID=UPI001E4F54A1|nr:MULTISPECIES: Hsp33 family molecular chaperone HslO [unclassified Pantoea]MCE0492168.1 Hsp33 family molecular chaperone HslO [Pantoea sp. Mb-10]MCE0503211.1 Hsp33 family molecular chaperone HslO [Pantoea sp. Pb-8]